MNKKLFTLSSLTIAALVFASPAYAATGDVANIETFIKSIIIILVKIAGLASAGFFVWGGDLDISPVQVTQKPWIVQRILSSIQPLV